MRGRGAAGRLAMRRGGRHRGGAPGRGGALSRGAARGGMVRGEEQLIPEILFRLVDPHWTLCYSSWSTIVINPQTALYKNRIQQQKLKETENM